MRHSITIAGGLVVVKSGARSQTTDASVQPQTTQRADATGVVGPFTEGTAPPELVPMTPSEHLRLYLRRTFEIGPNIVSAGPARIHHWERTPKQWCHGAAGSGGRF